MKLSLELALVEPHRLLELHRVHCRQIVHPVERVNTHLRCHLLTKSYLMRLRVQTLLTLHRRQDLPLYRDIRLILRRWVPLQTSYLAYRTPLIAFRGRYSVLDRLLIISMSSFL